MEKYKSDIAMGERYRDDQTGLEGVATAVTFHQFGCERVNLEVMVNGEIKEYGFDAPRLTRVGAEKPARLVGTGGPERGGASVRKVTGQ